MKKFKKSYTLLILILALSMVLTACGGSDSTPSNSDKTPANEASTDSGNTDATDEVVRHTNADNKVVTLNGDLKALEGPVYLTSVGQSADVSMLDALMKKVGVEYTFNSTAKADDIKGSKTIIIASGASSKGLGAAGISADEEKARAQEILDFCKAEDITVIMAHLGGVARRGELSDQFADMVMDYSHGILMVEDGNDDGKFSDFAENKNIPITLVNTIADCMDPLKVMFGN
ncbi:MAG: DUF6305 family protein [Tissierellaceae bacterium]|nr:DUF6305 family protein [Tissierellaceae bacterium]